MMDDGSRIDPDEVRSATFPGNARRVDARAVTAYLSALAARIEAANALTDGLRRRVENPTRPAVVAPPPSLSDLTDDDLTSLVGSETAGVLATARRAAEEIRSKAEEAASRLLREAHDEARRIVDSAKDRVVELTSEAQHARDTAVAEATADAERVAQDAERDAHRVLAEARERARREQADVESEKSALLDEAARVLAEAREQGREMIGEAKSARGRVLDDLQRRREQARLQIAGLEDGRRRLLDSYAKVREQLDEITAELDPAADVPHRPVDPGFERTPLDIGSTAKTETDTETASATATGAEAEDEAFEDAVHLLADDDDVPLDVPADPLDVAAVVAAPDDDIAAEAAPEPAEAASAPDGDDGDAGEAAAAAAAITATHVETDDTVAQAADTPSGPSDPGERPLVAQPEADRDPAGSDQTSTIEEAAMTTEPEPEPTSEPARADVDDVVDLDAVGLAAPEAIAPDPEVDAATEEVEAMFARLREERVESVARAHAILEQTSSDPASAAGSGGDVELIPAAFLADSDTLAARDEALQPLETALGKALKRQLADEQNEVLDRLRQSTTVTVEEIFGGEDAQIERYAEVAAGPLRSAVDVGVAHGGGIERAVDVHVRAVALGAAIVEPLRRRVDRAIDAVDGDADAVDERVRALYREWKVQVLGPTASDALLAAHGHGVLIGAPASATVSWRIDPAQGPCPDAQDNALAGATAPGTVFPTGDLCPQAHPGCRCVLFVDQG